MSLTESYVRIQPKGIKLWQFYTISGILGYIFVAFLIKANLPMNSWESIIPGLIAIGILAIAVFGYLAILKYPYLMIVSNSGVGFIYRHREIIVPWDSIRPPHMGRQLNFSWVFIPAFRKEGTWIDGRMYNQVNLTVNQVAAIVTHPNFRYPLKPNVAKSLGLPPSPV